MFVAGLGNTKPNLLRMACGFATATASGYLVNASTQIAFIFSSSLITGTFINLSSEPLPQHNAFASMKFSISNSLNQFLMA